jgi:hypothetical protein
MLDTAFSGSAHSPGPSRSQYPSTARRYPDQMTYR